MDNNINIPYQLVVGLLLFLFYCCGNADRKQPLGDTKESIVAKDSITTKICFEPIDFQEENLVTYVQYQQGDDTLPNMDDSWPGIDLYQCAIGSQGLEISFYWGTMSSEAVHIRLRGNSFSIRHIASGCTILESFDYLPLRQKLVIDPKSLQDRDSLIGYIDYKGVEDFATRKKRIQQLDEELSWMTTYRPKVVEVKGVFRLKFFPDLQQHSTEYDPYDLYLRSSKSSSKEE